MLLPSSRGIHRNPNSTLKGDVKVGQRTVKKYIQRYAGEMFDLVNDPDELVNLTGTEEHKDRLVWMRQEAES